MLCNSTASVIMDAFCVAPAKPSFIAAKSLAFLSPAALLGLLTLPVVRVSFLLPSERSFCGSSAMTLRAALVAGFVFFEVDSVVPRALPLPLPTRLNNGKLKLDVSDESSSRVQPIVGIIPTPMRTSGMRMPRDNGTLSEREAAAQE